jgi:hypothetical protein
MRQGPGYWQIPYLSLAVPLDVEVPVHAVCRIGAGPKIVVNQPHPAIRMVQRDERAELITMGA